MLHPTVSIEPKERIVEVASLNKIATYSFKDGDYV